MTIFSESHLVSAVISCFSLRSITNTVSSFGGTIQQATLYELKGLTYYISTFIRGGTHLLHELMSVSKKPLGWILLHGNRVCIGSDQSVQCLNIRLCDYYILEH